MGDHECSAGNAIRNGSGYGTVDANIGIFNGDCDDQPDLHDRGGCSSPGWSISVGACQVGPTKTLTSANSPNWPGPSFSTESAPLRWHRDGWIETAWALGRDGPLGVM